MLGDVSPDKPAPNPLPEVSILRDIIALLWEKTQNLEQIQTTYEEELAALTTEVAQHRDTIEQLTDQLRSVSCAESRGDAVQEDGGVPAGLSVTSFSETSDEPMSPGLSPAFTGHFNSNRVQLVTCPKQERSASFDSFELHEAEVQRLEEQVQKIPPILVTTLSYDTSIYNDSVSPANSSDIEGDTFEGVNPSNKSQVTMISHSNISNLTITDQAVEEDETNNVDKSQKRRDIVSQMYIAKMPVVVKENSVDSVHESEERDEFIVTPFKRPSPQDVLTKSREENLANFNWTRSDTFDVIPISQSSIITVPVKPKRGVISSPLHTQRHPTERDDTVTSMSRSDNMPHSRSDFHVAIHRQPIETCSEHSTFSQESCYSSDGGDGSSSFDYEVQYITPQLSEPDIYSDDDTKWSRQDFENHFSFDGDDFINGRNSIRNMIPNRDFACRDWETDDKEEEGSDGILTPQ